jgi:hypothetical protein
MQQRRVIMPDQGQNESTTRRRNPADNLTGEARRKGGKNSAQMQRRDQHGQFAGRKGESGGNNNSGGGGHSSNSSGRSASQGGGHEQR